MYFFAVVGKMITFGKDDCGIVTISKFLFSVSLFPALFPNRGRVQGCPLQR